MFQQSLPDSHVPTDDGRLAVHRSELPNGLKVLSYPKPGAGFAILQLWVGTGSIHEEEFTGRGLSHFLEHSLFDGSLPLERGEVTRPGYGNDEISRIIEEGGGYMNAFTSHENTCYMMEVLPGEVEKAVSLMEPLVMRPDFRPEVLEGEKGEIRAVLNELRRNLEDPNRELWERHAENVWGTSLYGVSVIGWESAVAKARVEELKAYHARRYVPNNMVLVVVGEVDPAKVDAAAREAWIGKNEDNPLWPAGPLKAVPLGHGFTPTAVKDLRIPSPKVADCQVRMSFKAPGWWDPNGAAGLLVLDMMLSSPGQGGLLQRLIEKEPGFHCREIGSSPSIDDHDATLDVMFSCEKPEHIDPIVKAVRECLAALGRADKPSKLWGEVESVACTTGDLAQARNLVLLSQLRGWESLGGIAMILGKHECSYGNADEHHRRLEAVRHVGAQSPIETARRLSLQPHVLTAFVPATGGGAVSSSAAAAEAPKLEVLPGGVEVVTQQDSSAPFFSITYAMRGGLLLEEARNNGIGMLFADWLGQVPEAEALQLDARGLSFGAESGVNSFLVKVSGPKTQLQWGLAFLKRRLFSTPVDEPTLRSSQVRCAARAEGALKNPEAEAQRRARASLFKGSGFALTPSGDPKVHRELTPAALEAHRQRLKSAPAVLAVVGDLGDGKFLSMDIHRLFLDVKVTKEVSPKIAATPASSREVVDVPFGTRQCYIQWVLPGPAVFEDEAARTVVQRVLADRIYEVVRIREGLSYSAGFFIATGFGPGMQVLYADTDSYDKINVIREAFAAEIKRMREEPLEAGKLTEAAAAAAFGMARANDSSADRAKMHALNRLYGKPLDDSRRLAEALRALTPAAVQAYCRKWLTPEAHYEVLVRDAAAAAPPAWGMGRKH